MLASSRPRAAGVPAFRPLLLGASSLVAGAIAVVAPGLMALLLLGGAAFLRAGYLFRDALFLLLVGSMWLTYGFANVGFRLGPLPLPVTELLLLPLVAWCLLYSRNLRKIGLPAMLLAVFLALAALRLVVDYPAYGTLAVRDFTLPLEALALLVGYWAINEFGVRWASKLFFVAFLGVAAYALTMPWRESIASAGPIVGLQQPVPLLGHIDAIGPSVAAAFFFFLIMLRPPWSLVLAVVCLAGLALIQMRGLFLALPLALLVLLFVSGKAGSRVAGKAAIALGVAAALLVVAAPFAPSGRMGPVTTTFLASQMGTLLGREGPGEGSYEVRQRWLNATLERQRSDATTLLIGFGLGPDLTGGFTTNDIIDVRKPHNDHVEVLARLGLVGLSLWAGLLVSLLAPAWAAARSKGLPEQEQRFLLWVLPSIAIYLVIATTQPLLAFPQGTVPLFLWLGMALAIARCGGEAASRALPGPAGGSEVR